jgi:hypothetical protein
MKTAALYDTDFAEWARQNAELLRAGRVSDVDLENVAEEIDGLSKHLRHSLYSRLVRLTEHLLKWRYQPERRGAGWQRTIIVQRAAILRLLVESPSLRPDLPRIVASSFHTAVRAASLAINRPLRDFPESCPFTLEELLDEEFIPE